MSLALAALLAAAAVDPALVGVYDGGRMEVAAGLALRGDGRFRYTLSYGALDEEAEGRWVRSGETVVLTSDPVTPPRFVTSGIDGGGKPGHLMLEATAPDGFPVQYLTVQLADAADTQDGPLGEVEFDPARPPRSARLCLPVYAICGEPVALPAGTARVRFAFEPNDLGKVDFRAQPVKIEGEALVLERHGEPLRFRRQQPEGK